MIEMFSGVTSLLSYIIPFLIVLTIVVFFHELGHYLVARWNKVDIDAFAVGFGPELIGFNDQHGTRWKLCAIPLGGYVKFRGDMNAASVPDHELVATMDEEQKRGSFAHKKVWQRALVVAAGPIANFILAILIFAGIFYFQGRYVLDPVVSAVLEDSAAEAAGIQPGDIIKAVDGQKTQSFSQIARLVAPNHGLKLGFTIERDGQVLQIPIVPKLFESEDRFGNQIRQGRVGITGEATETTRRLQEFNPLQAVGEGASETWYVVERTFGYLKAIVVGRESADQLGGPIRIAKVSGDVASVSWLALINLAAVLSVSIGLLNLFPIPMLDGGHLVFYAAEALRGRPLSDSVQEIGFRIGLTLVLMLMVFATWNDITQIVLR